MIQPGREPAISVDFASIIPDAEWERYRPLLVEALDRRMRFAIGGGVAFSLYSGRLRFTRDVDLFVLPEDRQRFIDLVTRHRFGDYFEQLPYDRQWIYRGYRDNAIIDIIWQMANQRAQVDETWLTAGPTFDAHGLTLRLIPPEELTFAKLYVLQRDRCDWPDLLSVLDRQAGSMDWDRLLHRLEDDRWLLAGLLCVYRWMRPEQAAAVPEAVWESLNIRANVSEQRDTTRGRSRIELIDTRDWFGPGGG